MEENTPKKKPGGKKPGQKFKSLLVWDVLQRETDQDHALGIEQIKDVLKTYGIEAERHSVSRDVKDLMELLNKGQENEADDGGLFDYVIEYDRSLHGYKITQRPYEFEELRLLAECVRSSRFVSKSQEKHLLAAIERMCSVHQVEELQNEVYLVDRNKTTNKSMMTNILKINQAIHMDRQISFRYLKYTIEDRTEQVSRRGGALYVMSPYKLLINDGNYYLLAWNEKRGRVFTYRLDRMKDLSVLDTPRTGKAECAAINIQDYTKQHFSMFSGEKKRVSVIFTNDLLDTVVDRFGSSAEVFYRPEGNRYFVVTADIAVSNQFFGWLCGFRKKAAILGPEEVRDSFRLFLDDIAKKYQDDER